VSCMRRYAAAAVGRQDFQMWAVFVAASIKTLKKWLDSTGILSRRYGDVIRIFHLTTERWAEDLPTTL